MKQKKWLFFLIAYGWITTCFAMEYNLSDDTSEEDTLDMWDESGIEYSQSILHEIRTKFDSIKNESEIAIFWKNQKYSELFTDYRHALCNWVIKQLSNISDTKYSSISMLFAQQCWIRHILGCKTCHNPQKCIQFK